MIVWGAYRRKENASLIRVITGYFWNKRDIHIPEKDIKVLPSDFQSLVSTRTMAVLVFTTTFQ